MLHIDITLEDTRIIADYYAGEWKTTVSDNLTGVSKQTTFTGNEMSALLAIATHPDGQPAGYEEMYELLEPKLADWPQELRPIP